MKKLAIILCFSLVLASFAGCGKGQTTKEDAQVDKAEVEAPAEEPSQSDEPEDSFNYEEAYSAVLDRYKEAISKKEDGNTLAMGGMSPVCEEYYEGDPLENIGYAYKDINNDGMPELFIGPVNDNKLIEVYTISGESVIVVISASSNVSYYFYNNTMFGNVGVMSDKTIGYNYYLLNGTSLQFVEGVLEDSLFTPEMTWYKAESDDYFASNDTVVTEEEAKKVITHYEEMITTPEYKTFATYGQ